jgi:hypothetical protein
MAQKITIDNTEYALDSLSDAARRQVINLHATDREIARVQSQLAMLQTARTTYAAILKRELAQEKKADGKK